MTATLDTMAKKQKPSEEPAELAAAREQVRQAKEQRLSLTGPDGLLKQLTKTMLETALDEELTEHLGHERRAPASSGNARNGSCSRTELTESLVPPRNERLDWSTSPSRSPCRAGRAGA